MGAPLDPTLDQLRIFLAVVDEGGFAAASRRLGRAVSVISYGIANLEGQLGVALFERGAGARRPRLTEAGRAVLAEARAVAGGIDGLRARVAAMRSGLEAEISVVVDVMLPARRLGAVLRAFAEAYPTVKLHLHIETLGAVTTMVAAREAVIGVAGPLGAGVPGLDYVAAGAVLLVPVAAPDHPLARAAAILPGEAAGHTQLVLADRSRATEGRDFSVLAPRTWRLADLGAKHALLVEGIGWGNMPLPMVADDIAAGRLVRLAVPETGSAIRYRLGVTWRQDSPPGVAACWLRNRFVELGDGDVPPDG